MSYRMFKLLCSKDKPKRKPRDETEPAREATAAEANDKIRNLDEITANQFLIEEFRRNNSPQRKTVASTEEDASIPGRDRTRERVKVTPKEETKQKECEEERQC